MTRIRCFSVNRLRRLSLLANRPIRHRDGSTRPRLNRRTSNDSIVKLARAWLTSMNVICGAKRWGDVGSRYVTKADYVRNHFERKNHGCGRLTLRKFRKAQTYWDGGG